MNIISKVKAALEGVFGKTAAEAAQKTGLIKRQRKFTAESLALTFILGLLNNPRANANDLARSAAFAGIDVSPQAVEKRITPELAEFFEAIFRKSTQTIVASNEALAPVLEKFTCVTLLDSSSLQLPDSQKERFAGTGGAYGSGQSALKLQTEWDLRSGALTCVQIEQGKEPDGASSRQQAKFEPGSLRITDLGYFNLSVFTAIAEAKAFFLSRVQHVTVLWVDGKRVGNVVEWLNSQDQNQVDCWVEVGAKGGVRCRLIAWKVPEEQANRRRQRVRKDAAKRRRQPTEAALKACEWTFLITNVPEEELSVKEVIVLYRARWQIELLFKRWKSIGLIDVLSGKNDVEVMVRFWTKLCAALIQHWLTIMVAWNSTSCFSLARVAMQISGHVEALLDALAIGNDVVQVLERFSRSVKRICQRDKRSKPGTFELLQNPELLDWTIA